MILELGPETVKNLLDDSLKLRETIERARCAIISDKSETVGELLYTKIEQCYPQFADKITGKFDKH